MAVKMKYGEIIKLNGKLGKLVADDKSNFLFHPANFGRYYYSDLEIVTENDVEETTHEEKVEYLKKEFSWGEILGVFSIAEYIIFKYHDRRAGNVSQEEYDKENHIKYHTYTNYKDDSKGYESLDEALLGVIINKYDGENGRAFGYVCNMIGM